MAREVADEDGAVRVFDDLRIAEGVIWKKSEKWGVELELWELEERERGICTESSRGTEVGSVNGVIVRENISAINASCLDLMIRQNLCLDRCREGYSFFSSLFSFQNLCVTLCLNSKKDCATPRREKKRNNFESWRWEKILGDGSWKWEFELWNFRWAGERKE